MKEVELNKGTDGGVYGFDGFGFTSRFMDRT